MDHYYFAVIAVFFSVSIKEFRVSGAIQKPVILRFTCLEIVSVSVRLEMFWNLEVVKVQYTTTHTCGLPENVMITFQRYTDEIIGYGKYLKGAFNWQ